jgi:hypothetical protein
VSFAAITLYVASQGLFIVVCFVIDSVRQRLDTPSYFQIICKIVLFFLEICNFDLSFMQSSVYV